MLWRLNICDATSGVNLVDIVWKWDGDVNSEGTSKLMQVFFQFAREMDSGELNQIVFENTQPAIRRKKRGTGSMYGGGNSGSSNRISRTAGTLRENTSVGRKQIVADCRRGNDILAAVFYELTDNVPLVARYTKAVVAEFEKTYAATVQSMKKEFKSLSDASVENAAQIQKQIHAKFQAFIEVANEIKNSQFDNAVDEAEIIIQQLSTPALSTTSSQ